MGFYEAGTASVAAGTGAAYQTLHGTTAQAARVCEAGFFCDAATASPLLIGRPANTPVATTSVLGNAVNPDTDAAATVNVDSAWSTAPTTPTVVYRRVVLPAVVGAGIVFVWDEGQQLVLSKSAASNQWLVVWNYSGSTGSILDTYWRWRE